MNTKPTLRKSALPDFEREVEILLRMKKARTLLGYSQRDFAERVGITRARLASYEECRAPVRYDIALLICRRMEINERWLATGFGLLQPSLHLNPEDRIRPGTLFSRAWDEILAKEVADRHLDIVAKGRVYLGKTNDPIQCRRELFQTLIRSWAETWVEKVPPESMEGFANMLVRSVHRFEKKYRLQPMPPRKEDLTSLSMMLNMKADLEASR